MLPLLVLVLSALGASTGGRSSSVITLEFDVETPAVEVISCEGSQLTDVAEEPSMLVGVAEGLLFVPSAVTFGAWMLVETGSVASGMLTAATPVVPPPLVALAPSFVLEPQAGMDNEQSGIAAQRSR